MREIKFRAWDKENRRMYEVTALHSNGDCHVDEPRSVNSVMIHKEEFELMQYTGLKDKNGAEIYEEDIVKMYRHGDEDGKCEDYEVLRMVVWFNAGFRLVPLGIPEGKWVLPEDLTTFGLSQDSGRPNGEVIGNVYANPELTKNDDRRRDKNDPTK